MVNSRLWNVLSRVLCFSSGNGNHLSANERKRGLRQNRPPFEKAALATFNSIELVEWAWMLPVAEAQAVVIRSSTEIQNYAEENETNEGICPDGLVIVRSVS